MPSPIHSDMTTEKGWSIDVDVLQALIAPKTKAIAIINPSNPTVSCLNQQKFTELEAVCRKLINDQILCQFFSNVHKVYT